MKKPTLSLALCALLVACGSGSNPFTPVTTTTPTTPGTGTPIASDRTLPPGTVSPSSNSSIFRTEPTSTEDATDGNGYATNISYDAAADEFTVDNLAFDGDNAYARGTAVSSLGQYAVYEADTTSPAIVSATPITQLSHRAIYGVSASGNTQFAIVRTGSYVQYGFGGFVYQRDGSVTLPTTGQARYTGSAAGLRDFNGRGGLQYTTSDVAVDIDFDDFNGSGASLGAGVRGEISNRRVFDINGNDITSTIVSNINTTSQASLTTIPSLRFLIGPNALDANGEITGTLSGAFVDDNGTLQTYQEGNYYAILSDTAGGNASELVGVIVVEGSAEEDGVEVRETSGFILLQ